jgi:hypothetical protein
MQAQKHNNTEKTQIYAQLSIINYQLLIIDY